MIRYATGMRWLPVKVAIAGLLWFSGAEAGQDQINAPVITNLKFEPSSGPQGSHIVVRIQIFDRQGREDIVPVLSLLREGRELIEAPVYDDGTHGDRLPSDGFYTGLMMVPFTASPGNHWFVVFIYDKAGHRSNLLIYEFLVSEERKHA